MTFWLISLQQALPTLPTPEPISEGWELVETCGIPLYPPSPEKTSEARRILDRVSEQLQEEEESKASLREWLMDDQNSSAESAVDYGLYSELNAPPPPHRDSRSGPSTDENAAPRGDSKSELKQVTNQEDDSVEYNIVSLDFYEEEHDERYKHSKACQRAVKYPLNTTPLTIRNTSIKKFWRVHIRHCGESQLDIWYAVRTTMYLATIPYRYFSGYTKKGAGRQKSVDHVCVPPGIIGKTSRVA